MDKNQSAAAIHLSADRAGHATPASWYQSAVGPFWPPHWRLTLCASARKIPQLPALLVGTDGGSSSPEFGAAWDYWYESVDFDFTSGAYWHIITNSYETMMDSYSHATFTETVVLDYGIGLNTTSQSYWQHLK